MNGETCVLSASTVHLRYESQQELNAKLIVIISVTADSSLLSPTEGVNRISPDTAIHDPKWLRKSVYNDKYTFNIIETIVDNDKNDATHADKQKTCATPQMGPSSPWTITSPSHFRRCQAAGRMAKLDVSWQDGVFLGYRSLSGEVVVGTAHDVLRTRTVRRRPEEQRWTSDCLDMVGSLPWKPNPSDDLGGEVMPSD